MASSKAPEEFKKQEVSLLAKIAKEELVFHAVQARWGQILCLSRKCLYFTLILKVCFPGI